MKKTLSDIPFSIIEKAINEDIEAIDYILAHYRNYIIRLSTRVARDENNNEYMYVDDDMRSRLESKLIYSIIKKFKILSQNNAGCFKHSVKYTIYPI